MNRTEVPTDATAKLKATLKSLAPRLLVIDDDPVHRTVIARIGRQASHEVREASSYAQACELIRNECFHCITLDLTLGDGDGADVLRVLAKHDFPGSVIIISSADGWGRSEAKSIARTLGINVSRSFPKPLDLTALRVALAAAQHDRRGCVSAA
ncbi:MAG: response regulator [Variibacter sp.]|nr:response regulator [Variibacter sp.]